MITFEQFKAMDIRIARIVSAEDHPDADKLYVLTVDTGEKEKKVVAGIKPTTPRKNFLINWWFS